MTNPTEQPETVEGKITPAELVEWFGTATPVEAMNALFDSPPGWTIGQVRAEVRRIAASHPTPADTAMPDDAVERVAKLLHHRSFSDRQWDDLAESGFNGRDSYRDTARAVLSVVNRPRTAADIETIVREWLDADDPTQWGAFEKALDAALTTNAPKATDAAKREGEA